MTVKILAFDGSGRKGSVNHKLLTAGIAALKAEGASVTEVNLHEFDLPIYDGDLEAQQGLPENVLKLKELFNTHDGFLIASPEYNASIPPLVKNTIDWVSRIRNDGGRPFSPYRGKVAALCSSSEGNFGGMRCLYHLRAVLMNCQVEIITPQCSVSRAHEAFDENGDFREERLHKMMQNVCRTLIERARMLSTRVEG